MITINENKKYAQQFLTLTWQGSMVEIVTIQQHI